MTETFDIAGYTRISVDDEQDQKNISIENQKAIIEDYVKTHFPVAVEVVVNRKPLTQKETLPFCQWLQRLPCRI